MDTTGLLSLLSGGLGGYNQGRQVRADETYRQQQSAQQVSQFNQQFGEQRRQADIAQGNWNQSFAENQRRAAVQDEQFAQSHALAKQQFDEQRAQNALINGHWNREFIEKMRQFGIGQRNYQNEFDLRRQEAANNLMLQFPTWGRGIQRLFPGNGPLQNTLTGQLFGSRFSDALHLSPTGFAADPLEANAIASGQMGVAAQAQVLTRNGQLGSTADASWAKNTANKITAPAGIPPMPASAPRSTPAPSPRPGYKPSPGFYSGSLSSALGFTSVPRF